LAEGWKSQKRQVQNQHLGHPAIATRKQILTDYGSYKNHFRVLSEECNQSLRTIAEAFDGLISKPAGSAPVR
jgi:hypothetical protein